MKKLIKKIKSLDKGTIARTIALIITIINEVVAVIGATSYANASWYQIVSLVAIILTSIWTCWKNNDYTSFAQLATKVLHALKDGEVTKEEVENMLK